MKDEDVVAGCVAALAEDSYDMVELEVGEVGVVEVADEGKEDGGDEDEEEEEDKEEEYDDDGVYVWLDGTG